jgi:two-component system LytT family sensor kinase
MIAPMLFIPFIENAFKHTNLTIDGAVRIIFVIDKEKVMFECENLVEQTLQTEKQLGGLGWKNGSHCCIPQNIIC